MQSTLEGKQTTQVKLRFIEDLKQTFESNPGLTPQFLSFCNRFRNDFRKYLESIGATKVMIDRGHFELNGFFTLGAEGERPERIWYFSTGDVRWSAQQYGMLVRTAKDYKDFTGGRNQKAGYDTQEAFESDMASVLDLSPNPLE